jgi:hypothetical protein
MIDISTCAYVKVLFFLQSDYDSIKYLQFWNNKLIEIDDFEYITYLTISSNTDFSSS